MVNKIKKFDILLLALLSLYTGLNAYDQLEQGCNSGEMEACVGLGLIYNEKQNYNKAIKLFTKACEGGSSLGCGTLGSMYVGGTGVKKNIFEAVRLYTKACDGDLAFVCTVLGNRYLRGDGVQQDSFKAEKFFTKACDGEDPDGCISLGFMHLNGSGGIPKDSLRAGKLFIKACDMNPDHDMCRSIKK